MSQTERKRKRVKKIMSDTADALKKEGVEFFIGAIEPDDKNGKAFVSSDIKGESMCVVLNLAFPEESDLQNLAIYVSEALRSRVKKPINQ